MALKEWISRRVFKTVHGNNLVYNTCWEDPRLDRVALDLTPDDDVLVITSAGCNALDYTLVGPNHVYAVDMNPRQNALLELKKAAIRELEFDDFFRMFGEGFYAGVREVYQPKLRPHLSERSRIFWDKRIRWFDNPRRSFYFRGTSGSFARMMNVYIDKVIKVRPHIERMLNAQTMEEQHAVYYDELYDKFWTGLVKFTMNRDTTMSMLGVPKAQRRQIEDHYPGGLVKYIQDCVEGVFVKLPIKDNYFWRVYMNGSYTRECCPEYLKEENFNRLKQGQLDRLTTHTDSVQGFLEKHDGTISRFILLDHMDWLSDHFFPYLEAEWQAIIDKARPDARILWRSGGLRTDFIGQVQVQNNGQMNRVSDMLTYDSELAGELHQKDRVHTYASFYIAELSA
ncbi:MAG: BtaA family protein [Pirellulaceae bacterium]|nr:BtaA family protein [Pirellulaceae bacterium]